jgi:hypothetical protein
MKYALILAVLAVSACTTLSPTQSLIAGCKDATAAYRLLTPMIDDGTISNRDTLQHIKAASDSISAICTNRQFILDPDIPNAAALVASQAVYLTTILTEAK